MIGFPPGVRVWLATGHCDMRKGFPGLALLVQEKLKADPHGGHLFVFRGRRGGLVKVIWHDGRGVSVLEKAGARALHLAYAVGRCGDDLAGTARLSPGRHRLAGPAADLAS
jgi:hypothetical protein